MTVDDNVRILHQYQNESKLNFKGHLYGHQNVKEIAIFIYENHHAQVVVSALTKFVDSLKLSKDNASISVLNEAYLSCSDLKLNILLFLTLNCSENRYYCT